MDVLKQDPVREAAVRRRVALVLEDRLARSVAAVKAYPDALPRADGDSPLGKEGRRALATADEPRIRHALEEWLNAHEGFCDAAAELDALMADDPLRGGRHQAVYDAGVRWRREVLAQRRAAFMAAARTAQRAV